MACYLPIMSAIISHSWHLQCRLEYLNISQADLVRKLGDAGCECTPAAVSRWLSGKAYPSRQVLPVLLNCLELSGRERDGYIKIWAGCGL